MDNALVARELRATHTAFIAAVPNQEDRRRKVTWPAWPYLISNRALVPPCTAPMGTARGFPSQRADTFCKLLLQPDDHMVNTVLPKVMAVIQRAQDVPFHLREQTPLAEATNATADFQAKLGICEIEPITTSVEADTDGAVDPGAAGPHLDHLGLM